MSESATTMIGDLASTGVATIANDPPVIATATHADRSFI
jgi:hypothetical protein